jgi:hypothetical protein
MKTTKPCSNCSDKSYTAVATRVKAATTATIQSSTTCTECGGLECLCRPRFFDGQLLSADDLTRMQRYILKKNRLHNRALIGWGVVGGLEVVCDPCEDQVIVREGYALSPCGDDIIVCQDVKVPICELIKDCRSTVAYDDCYSDRLTAAELGCEEALQDWTLLICYDEAPSRGITPLRVSSGGGCARCNCGGSASCGCSCHTASTSVTKASARVSPQCEPSVICEGFHFEIRKAVAQTNRNKLLQGEMIDRFRECYRELVAIIPEAPQDLSNAEQMRQFCCDFKEALKEFFSVHSTYACLLDEALAKVVCLKSSDFPNDPGGKMYLAALTETINDEVMIAAEYLRYCLCTLLLPPVPEASADNCVPLATVQVRRSDCKIIDICNLTSRRFAVTLPNLSYWMSWLPVGQYIERLLASICCSTLIKPEREFTLGGATFKQKAMYTKAAVNTGADTAKTKSSSAAAQATPVNLNRDMASIFSQALDRGSERLDMPTMILDALGATDASGRSFMSAVEQRNPLTALLANQLAMPLTGSFLPPEMMNMTGADLGQAVRGTTQAASTADVEAMKAEVSKLTKLVNKQQKTINTLSKKVAVRKTRK